MRKYLLLLALLACLAPASLSAAGVPTSVPISGTLTDSEGVALEGAHKVDIIWFNQTGELLHEEQIELNGAYLDHMAGQGDDSQLAAAAMRGELYEVELIIDGEVMSPRIRLGSVPYALFSGRAGEAAIASNCISLADRPASDYVARENHTWASLSDKPSFQVTPPLAVAASTNSYLFSLAPCGEDQTLVTSNGSWSCQDVTDASGLVLGSATLTATSPRTLEIAAGSIQNHHISALGLAPSAIAGKALVAVSLVSQTLMDTLFAADGRVAIGSSIVSGFIPQHPNAQLHVAGLVVADQFALSQPQTRTLMIAPEQLRMLGSNYEQGVMLLDDGSLAVENGASVKLRAPIHLPPDARVTSVSCERLLTGGALVARARVVEFGALNTLTRTVLGDWSMGNVSPSAQLQAWASPPLTIDLARPGTPVGAQRFALEVDWTPNQPGLHARLVSCQLAYTTTSL